MSVTKVVNNTRTVTEFSVEEFRKALGLDAVLAVYIVGGKVEVVTKSE